MGIFDFLKSKHKAGTSEPPKFADKTVARHADNIAKRAQNYDRQEAIDVLSKIGSGEAAAVLLKRFTFVIEPSITDQEERETAFRGIVLAGKDALPAIREFCLRAEGLSFPLRMMREILSDDQAFVGEVLTLLGRWDTEYDRNPDPKIQLIVALEEIRDPRVREGVERFLDDVHEPTRFHAVTTLLALGDPASAGALARALVREEAQRTINRIAEGLAARAWPIPEEERPKLAEKLPRGYVIDASGVVVTE